MFVEGRGKTFRFWHDGRNAGFDALMVELPNAGKGAVIMIDANDNKGTIKDIIGVIGKEYDCGLAPIFWTGIFCSYS